MFGIGPVWDIVVQGSILSALALGWIILLVRVNGLRSFSKMTNFDFVMTVAVGSLLAGAGQSTSWSAFSQVLVALSALFFVQYVIARIRRSSDTVENILQNQPILLMRDGRLIPEALDRTRVSESDIRAKLREANVLDPDQVRAVILETTGDISVLHGESLSDDLLRGTRDVTERKSTTQTS